MRRLLSSIAVLVTVAPAGGCGGRSETVKPSTDPATDPPAEPAVVERDVPSQPGPRVVRLWEWLQLGDVPDVARSYHPEAVRQLGPRAIAGAIAAQQPGVSGYHVRRATVERTPTGTLVTLDVANDAKQRARYGYVLRRDGAQWRVLYDTLLIEGLRSYIQTRVQASIDPGAETPSPRAQREAEEAVRVLRESFLPAGRAEARAVRRALRSGG